GRPQDSGMRLDPASPGADGTRALVDVLGELGADVDVGDGLPEPDDDVALLLTDQLEDGPRSALTDWVRDGGTLVVADPRSSFAPAGVGTTSVGVFEATLQRSCDQPALADARAVSAPSSTTYEAADGATGCFPRGEGHWLVAHPEGDGTVVALGGPGFLTNAQLGRADNAVLAAALLAPARNTRLVFLQPAPPGSGDQRLTDLIPARVKLAFAQLLIAFGVVVLWRVRRLGPPVSEDHPVQVPGSELVVAVGNLLQRTGGRGRATDVLRQDLRRDLAVRLGLPDGLRDEALAAAVAARSPVAAAEVLAVLTAPPPDGDAALVGFAQLVEDVRRAALQPNRTEERSRA
ncbi:MAG: DUF4350 domain-containing protein, partial [Egibacteraceae bacterium]